MQLKLLIGAAAFAAAILLSGCADKEARMVRDDLSIASVQLGRMADAIRDSDRFQRSYDPATGTYKEFPYTDWTCGFFPGELWLYYEMTGDGRFKSLAEHFTAKAKEVPFMTDTHDLGFMVMCSYGHQWEAEHDAVSREAIVQAARSLMSRFDETIGLVRSWDFGPWNYPVIIDNMMNLELLVMRS